MGASVEATRAAAECADIVVAEINSRMPRCSGDTLVHISNLDRVCYVERDLPKYVLPGFFLSIPIMYSEGRGPVQDRQADCRQSRRGRLHAAGGHWSDSRRCHGEPEGAQGPRRAQRDVQ